MKGRKRLSTGIKRLRGTVRTDRLPAGERLSRVDNQASTAPPSTDGARLPMEPPPELDGDAIARREWRRLVPMLSAARLVGPADRAPLIAACLEWSTYVRAIRLSRRGDMTVRRGSGGRGIAPSIAVARGALQSLLRLWPELRMTPPSRSSVRLDGPGPGGDAFDEFDRPMPRPH